jgi:argininosuccinate lyase
MAAAAGEGVTTATDVADWLVQRLGVPFRQAHHITGQVVRLAESKACALADLSLAELRQIDSRITAELFERLTPLASAASRTSFGGTAPRLVAQAVVAARERFL